MKALLALATLGAVLLASGCATDPLAPAGGLEPWEKVEIKKTYTVELPPRERAAVRPAGGSPEREGYVPLGTIEVTLSEERCFPAGGKQECGSKAHDLPPTERLVREAARVGGDLVVLTADNARASRQTSRNGRCLATQQIMQPSQRCNYETWCPRPGQCFQRTTTCSTQYTPVTICSNYEKVWGTERAASSAGTVYRKDPDFALQVKHGDDFAAALRSGDVKRVTRLAGDGMRLDIQDIRGRHPLLLAIESGSLATVSYALTKGADPNLEVGEPMLLAIRRQNAAILRVLLERGGDPNIGLGFWKMLFARPGEGIGRAPGRLLQAAVDAGNLELARLLLDKGADARAPDHTPLQAAIAKRNLPMIDLLIARGASIDGSRGLTTAAQAKDFALMELLIEKGADVNAMETGGQTALYHAALQGNADMTRLLIRRGADVDKRGVGQVWNPIIVAVMNGHEAVVAQLIEAKADLSQTNNVYGLGWIASLGGFKESNVLQIALRGLKEAKAPEMIARRQRIVDMLRAAGAKE